MTTAPVQTLDEVDPNAYPHAVADWSRAEAYPDHGGDATKYAWELTRRDRRFQLLSDVHRISYERETEFPRTHAVPDRIVAAIHGLPGIEDFVQQAAALDDPRVERLGLLTPEIDAEARLRHVLWLALREWFAPFHTASEGAYREGLPPADRRVFDRGRTPPWPLHWPGKDAETQGAHALLDLVDYPAGLLREILLEMLTENERAVVEGRTVGSLDVHAQANAYSSTYWSGTAPPPKYEDEVRLSFRLSMNIGAQVGRACAMLEDMQHRAGFEKPERAMPLPEARTGRRILRYLDWQAEGDCDRRGAAVEFKRAIGVKESNSTEWRRLRARVKEYTADPVALVRLR